MWFPLNNQFSPEDRRAMLALARDAIVSKLENKPLRRTPSEPSRFSLSQGVFVTLEVHGQLRGCIGVIEPREPLRESIVHCAQSAAFHDPCFPSFSRSPCSKSKSASMGCWLPRKITAACCFRKLRPNTSYRARNFSRKL